MALIKDLKNKNYHYRIYLTNFLKTNLLKKLVCSHLSEKASKGRFLKPEKLQNQSNEEKGKETKKERGEEKKAMLALLVFIIATLVHLAITFSKIRVDINKVKYRIFKIKIR